MTGFFLERCALFYYETCYAQIGDLEAITSVKLPRRHRKLFRLTNKTFIQHYLGSMLWFFKACAVQAYRENPQGKSICMLENVHIIYEYYEK